MLTLSFKVENKEKVNNREKRKVIAEETLTIIENGFFISPNGKRIDINEAQIIAESETKVYSPSESDKLINKSNFEMLEKACEISVTDQTTLDATRALIKEGYENVLCLNFASAKNPGGGFWEVVKHRKKALLGLQDCIVAS